MSDDYEKLISEAFIDPIRSVLIVDDDYPTLDEILKEKSFGQVAPEHGGKSWRDNPNAVLQVINEFRQPHGGPYILDIHDGEMPPPETEAHQAYRLQQTDLLVLDYELNGQIHDGGEKALTIARKALTNNHFNIILVHTREPLGDVFARFLLGLLSPEFSFPEGELTNDQEEVLGNHLSNTLGLIEVSAYFELRRLEKRLADIMSDEITSGPLVGLFSYLNNEVQEGHRKFLLLAALAEFERLAQKDKRFSNEDIGIRAWQDSGLLWIRCDQGFIAFKQKGDGIPLLDTLRQTLVSWGPFPSRLLLTKLRAVMNERGIEVQDDALGDRAVGAAWFYSMVGATSPEKSTRVEQVVRNHSEQLLDQLLPGVADYASRLAAAHGTDATAAVRIAFNGYDLNNSDERRRAFTEQNAFSASKPVGGIHLEFGHILRIANETWLCLTPACDMPPNVRRNNTEFEPDNLEGCKRFTAMRLHDRVSAAEVKSALKEAQRAEYVFANIANESGKTTASVFGLAKDVKSAPAIMTMYAENDGRFSNEKFTLHVCFVSTRDVGEGEEKRRELILARKSARVCGHLRYEYALRIQSMYAEGQSRIGLDYVKSN